MPDTEQKNSMAKTLCLIVIIASVAAVASTIVLRLFFDELSPALRGGITGGAAGGAVASFVVSRKCKADGKTN